MQTHTDKNQETQSRSVDNTEPQRKNDGKYAFQFVDNRTEAVKMRKLQEMANSHAKKNAFQFVDNRPEVAQTKTLQRQAKSNTTQTIQRVSNVEYFAPQTFAYTNPPLAGGGLNANGNVGNMIQADLDLTDPIMGSGVGGGAIAANLMTDLALNFPGIPGGWVQGHLLNSNLGGLGITSNLFPITTAANGKHSSIEHEVKELLYNQPPMGVFSLANTGYVQYSVDATPVAGKNNATTQNPDVDFSISYRTQQDQAPGPAGAPIWNPPKNITITSRAAGNTVVPGAWTPLGAGMGMPIGGGGVVNVAQWTVNILTNPANPNHLPMLGALGLIGPPGVPAGANNFLTQQAPGGGLKIIGWQF
ncbi:MAG: hypothetical protein AAFX87_11420 [Bacteroidota bacterium]